MTADSDLHRLPGLDVDVPGFMISFGLHLKGRHERLTPPEPFGPSGFRVILCGLKSRGRSVEYEPIGSVIVTQADHDRQEWLHGSIARKRMPDYADLVALKAAIWGDDGYAYQVFPSQEEHVSIHERALHLWGRADGQRVLPAFGVYGTI